MTRHFKYFIILCFSLQPLLLRAESDLTQRISSLFDRIVASNKDSVRIFLNDSLLLCIDEYVVSDSVFDHEFQGIRYLGQMKSEDSRVKIITWNLALRENPTRYYCYIIHRTGKKGTPTLSRLIGETKYEAPQRETVYRQENWYGALYYGIGHFRLRGYDRYILLGIDYASPERTRKIIDIIGFDENGTLSFGAPYLKRGANIYMREIFEYSADGVVTLRLEGRKLIAFNHIAEFSTGHGDSQGGLGADFSFDGYKFKKGYWNFVENIDLKQRR
jgi:hypothetical protein